MRSVRAAGFTLIELLTVIAIIAILAAMTAVTLPRVLERAKVTKATAALRAIATSLHAYYTEHGTYPPGYGYQLFDKNGVVGFNHEPYMDEAGINNAQDSYDLFSENYDTNSDGRLSRLEFVPLPDDLGAPLSWLLKAPADPPYPGGEAVDAFAKRGNERRPYVYVPYYKKDIERMHRVAGDNWDGVNWHVNFITANTLVPPPQYDAFVLISVGPLENTRGLLEPPGGETAWLSATPAAGRPELAYYILGMRAAYLATRDADKNGQLDFDYIVRTRQGEGKIHPGMPDGKNLGIAAPIIWKSE